jgi:hypothetical protein
MGHPSHLDESGIERMREADDASDTRRWSLDHDHVEPLGVVVHVLIGIALVALLIWLAQLRV